MSNPVKAFKGIADFYEESVKKSDAAGLADVYKQATDIVFNALKKELKDYRKFDITIEDIDYLDGYFIFGTGTNSVVHFHIKETPGWKYGIWWSPVEKKDSTKENPMYETDRLHCSIFTQYEEEIDKFKPSASMVVDEFDVYLDRASTHFAWDFAQDVKFIHDEPYLAFYREMHYSDFNKEYVSRAKAKSYFERHFKQKRLEEEITALNNRELLKTIYTILEKEEFDSGNCFIHDRGDCWSPRYEVIMKNPWEDIKDGCYGIFDLMEDNYATESRKLWDKTIRECEKRAKKIGDYWYSSSCCHDSIVILAEDSYNEAFAESKKVDLKTLLEDTKND